MNHMPPPPDDTPETDPERPETPGRTGKTDDEGSGPTPEMLQEAARKAEDARLTGIGGWLITYCAFQGLNLLSFLSNLGSSDDLDRLAAGDPVTAADLQRLISITDTLGWLSAGGIVAALALVAMRKKIAPVVNMGLLAAQCLLAAVVAFLLQGSIAPYIVSSEITVLMVGVAVQILINILWIAYFQKSRRVALTFTE